jgi:hypothetical protein
MAVSDARLFTSFRQGLPSWQRPIRRRDRVVASSDRDRYVLDGPGLDGLCSPAKWRALAADFMLGLAQPQEHTALQSRIPPKVILHSHVELAPDAGLNVVRRQPDTAAVGRDAFFDVSPGLVEPSPGSVVRPVDGCGLAARGGFGCQTTGHGDRPSSGQLAAGAVCSRPVTVRLPRRPACKAGVVAVLVPCELVVPV